jgi:tight adherence protein B
MGAMLTSILAGGLLFVAVYLSFERIYERTWTRLLAFRDETVKVAEAIFIQKTPEEMLNYHIICGAVCAVIPLALLFSVFLPAALIAGWLAFWYGWRIPLFVLKNVLQPRRINTFSVQMVDALTLMANGMKSGLNVPQTLQIVVDEMPNPIREEFSLVLSENKLGLTLEKAFENLGQRIPSEDVMMFVTSVNILRETGGNIAETFQTITTTIRERMKLQAKIAAMTAQGMMSAYIVAAMPWGLGIMLYTVDPVMMTPLFTTKLGWVVILLILMLEGVGFYVILKMVKIRV